MSRHARIDRYVPFRSSRRRDRTLRAVHSQRHNGRNGGPGDRRRRGEARRPADRDAHARHAADDADDDPLRRSDRGSARLLRRKDRLAARRGRDADRARPGLRLFENRGAELPPAGRNAPAGRTGLSGFGRHIPQVDDIQDARHDAGRRPRRHDGAALGMPASGRIDPARARHARGGANRRAVRTVRTIQ